MRPSGNQHFTNIKVFTFSSEMIVGEIVFKSPSEHCLSPEADARCLGEVRPGDIGAWRTDLGSVEMLYIMQRWLFLVLTV